MNKLISNSNKYKEAKTLTNQEIEILATKIYGRVRNIPGIDQTFIRKCLQGIASLSDNEVEEKIKLLAKFI